jgi:hypothetical protein
MNYGIKRVWLMVTMLGCGVCVAALVSPCWSDLDFSKEGIGGGNQFGCYIAGTQMCPFIMKCEYRYCDHGWPYICPATNGDYVTVSTLPQVQHVYDKPGKSAWKFNLDTCAENYLCQNYCQWHSGHGRYECVRGDYMSPDQVVFAYPDDASSDCSPTEE